MRNNGRPNLSSISLLGEMFPDQLRGAAAAVWGATNFSLQSTGKAP
jgi:hypothetical protein